MSPYKVTRMRVQALHIPSGRLVWRPARPALDGFGIAPRLGHTLMDELLPVYDPCVDVRESRADLVFLADLPGLTRRDVEILLCGNRLTITGEREREPLGEGEELSYRGRRFGTFTCSFPLPRGLDGRKATASMCNGVLKVRVPRTGPGHTMALPEL